MPYTLVRGNTKLFITMYLHLKRDLEFWISFGIEFQTAGPWYTIDLYDNIALA